MTTRTSTFQALRHRDYRLYFYSQAISLIGTWLQQAALVWLAYDLTGLSRWTGLVSMATILPTAFLAPFSGWLADRFPKKKIVQLAQTGMLLQAASLAALVWLGHATPERLVLWSLFAGMMQAIDLPTRLSYIKELTGPEDLANAVALNSMQFNLARALGLPAGRHCRRRRGGIGVGFCHPWIFWFIGVFFVGNGPYLVHSHSPRRGSNGHFRQPPRPGHGSLDHGNEPGHTFRKRRDRPPGRHLGRFGCFNGYGHTHGLPLGGHLAK